jgi:hypothetical protein
MEDGGSWVQFPARERDGSLLQIMQRGSAIHPDTYSMSDDGSFLRSEAARRKSYFPLIPRLKRPS